MTTTWIDTVVLIIVVAIGLAIFYKALKEPVDRAFYWIKSAIVGIFESIGNVGGSRQPETTISYG